MTAGDGDAEQLRVPRWIARSGLPEGGPAYGPDDPELAPGDPDDRGPNDRDPGRDPGRDPDDRERDEDDRDEGDRDPGRDPDDFDAHIYVPRRYSSEADDDRYSADDDRNGGEAGGDRVSRYGPEADGGIFTYEPDFDDIEYPARPPRRAAWGDTRPGGERVGADRYGAERVTLDSTDDGDDGRPRHAATPRNRRLLIAWLAAAVVIVVALPVGALLYSSSGKKGNVAGGQRTGAPSRTEAQPSVDGVVIPGSQPATGSPSEVEPTGRSNAAPNPGQFGPITYEAETNANTLAGSAAVVTYPGASGGSIVRNIGDWGIGSGPGTLRFENVDVPAAGSYSLTFFHVNIDNERIRTAVITVDGIDPILVTITGTSTCCLSTTIRVTLKQGRNSITFSNNSAHAPSIDKITISQP